MVNLEGRAQVKRTTLLGYNLVYSISSEVVLGVSCCCVLSPFISHHDSHLFAELKLCGYLCCHFFFFIFYGFSQMQECKCLVPQSLPTLCAQRVHVSCQNTTVTLGYIDRTTFTPKTQFLSRQPLILSERVSEFALNFSFWLCEPAFLRLKLVKV